MNGFDFDVFAAHHGSNLNMVSNYVANTRRQATVLKKSSHKNPCRTLFYTNFHNTVTTRTASKHTALSARLAKISNHVFRSISDGEPGPLSLPRRRQRKILDEVQRKCYGATRFQSCAMLRNAESMEIKYRSETNHQ